jgi:phosphatidylglycerol:prolipoprotein diacylglycerol transferase
MHPVLFRVGDFAIHSYGAMGAIGFLAVVFGALRRAEALGWSRDRVVDVMFWSALAGIVGARGLYLLTNPDQFHSLGDAINVRTGGLVFYGAMLTGFPVAAWLIRRAKLPYFALMDVFSTVLPLGHAISRVGCLFAGCCFGKPTDLPWGVTYTDPLAMAPHDVALHPTQVYESAYLLVIFAIVNEFYPNRKFDGQVTLLYLTLYPLFRTLNEFLRYDATRGWFMEGTFGPTISTSQAISVLIAGVACGVFLVGAKSASTHHKQKTIG